MKKSSKHSKGKAITLYLYTVTMIGAAVLSTGVALGFLIKAHSYMHVPALNASSTNAIASNQSTHASSGTANYKQ